MRYGKRFLFTGGGGVLRLASLIAVCTVGALGAASSGSALSLPAKVDASSAAAEPLSSVAKNRPKPKKSRTVKVALPKPGEMKFTRVVVTLKRVAKTKKAKRAGASTAIRDVAAKKPKRFKKPRIVLKNKKALPPGVFILRTKVRRTKKKSRFVAEFVLGRVAVRAPAGEQVGGSGGYASFNAAAPRGAGIASAASTRNAKPPCRLAGGGWATAGGRGGSLEFGSEGAPKNANQFIEIFCTDGDAGIQLFLDGEGWAVPDTGGGDTGGGTDPVVDPRPGPNPLTRAKLAWFHPPPPSTVSYLCLRLAGAAGTMAAWKLTHPVNGVGGVLPPGTASTGTPTRKDGLTTIPEPGSVILHFTINQTGPYAVEAGVFVINERTHSINVVLDPAQGPEDAGFACTPPPAN